MHHTTPTRRSAGGPARISIPAAIALVVALATTLLAAMPFAGPPQGAAAFAAKGPMVHVSERNIDFGNVEQFQQLEKVIRISNIGDAPLLLLKIDTDCGCTTGIPADSVIAPGRSTPLRISFATRESKGITEKKVTILTNDPAESKVTISLVADIRPLVEMTPERVRFEPLRAGETATQTVRLRAEKGFGLKVTGIDASERFLHVTSRAVPSADAEVIEIVVQVKPDAPAGPFRDDVEVHTLGKKGGTIAIPVSGSIVSYFVVPGDGRIVLPSVPPGKTAQQSLLIKSDGSKPYRLTAIDTGMPWLRGEIQPKGTDWVLTISVAPGAPAGAFRSVAKLSTSDPAQPQIEFLVQGVVRG